MRGKRNYILTAIAAFFMLVVVSCQKEEDTGPSGPPGSGDMRAAYAGNWRCTETSSITPGTTVYYVQISLHPTINNQIQIANIYNLGTTVSAYALVNGNNTFAIPQQVLVGNTIEGNGTLLNSTNISMDYTATAGSTIDDVTCALLKQ